MWFHAWNSLSSLIVWMKTAYLGAEDFKSKYIPNVVLFYNFYFHLSI